MYNAVLIIIGATPIIMTEKVFHPDIKHRENNTIVIVKIIMDVTDTNIARLKRINA